MAKGRRSKNQTPSMFKKLKVPCPNCHAYKLFSWSPAGMSFTLLVGSIVGACVPIIGWLLLLPLLMGALVLFPTTFILYLIPAMRRVTVRCRQCEYRSSPGEVATAH